MTTVLYINRTDSVCGGCHRSCLPMDKAHETPAGYDQHAGCGAVFTHVSSEYNDYAGLYDYIKAMRPDLPFVDFWESRFVKYGGRGDE